MKLYKFIASTLLLSSISILPGLGQDAKPELSMNLSYNNKNNQVQFLEANVKAKVNGKFQPVSGLPLQFYITDEQQSNSLGKAITNEKGIAAVYITPAAKAEWMKSETRAFLVKSESTPTYDSTTATAEIRKSKISIDTGADKKVTATFLTLKKGKWIPVSGVDLVLAVKRMNSDLNVDRTSTHTTDSLGVASTDFSLTGLSGDSAGNITLIAKLQDNDMYGNLTAERIVPWGTVTRYVSDYNKRSLFARRRHSPYWLVFMTYSIGLTVWSVIFYLFVQIRRIKKLGISN